MGVYVVRRVVMLVPVLLGMSVIIFLFIHVAPSGPARAILGPVATPEQIAVFNRQHGLDQPLPVQYVLWLQRAITGDLGMSLFNALPVTDLIGTKMVPTVLLTALSCAISVPLGVAFGASAALRRGRLADTLSRFAFLVGLSMPSFWLGVLLLIVFAVQLRILPAGGYVPLDEDPIGCMRSLLLPALTLAIPTAAVISRIVRTSMLETMSNDYIRTAHSKGLHPRTVVGRHVLRNVALPTVTTVGLQISYLLGGAAIVETVFTIPGLGRGLVDAATNRDYAMVQGLTVVIALMTVLTALLVDLVYVYLDPRIRLR